MFSIPQLYISFLKKSIHAHTHCHFMTHQLVDFLVIAPFRNLEGSTLEACM